MTFTTPESVVNSELEIYALEASAREATRPADRPDIVAVALAAADYIAAMPFRAQRLLAIEALRDRRLSQTCREILHLFILSANAETGLSWLDHERIAVELDLSSKRIRNALGDLAEFGYIRRTDARRLGPKGLRRADVALMPADHASWSDLEDAQRARIKAVWSWGMSRDSGTSLEEPEPLSQDLGTSLEPLSQDLGTSSEPNPYILTTSDTKKPTPVTRVPREREPEGAGMAGSEVQRVQVSDADVYEARDAYNAMAHLSDKPICNFVTEARHRQIKKRLVDIGGVAMFRVALRAIDLDDFIAGRVPGRDGRPPYVIDIDRLFSTNSGLGDILARLIDLGLGRKPTSLGPFAEAYWNSQPNPGAEYCENWN